MSVSNRLTEYFRQHNICYDVMLHDHSQSSLGTAVSARIPMNRLAKAVMLQDHDNRKMMAVIPAGNRVYLPLINDCLKREFRVMKEDDIYTLFCDCEHGAVPPVGMAYHLETVFDDQLLSETELYLEGGDHRSLLHIRGEDFRQLMGSQKHYRFSTPVSHDYDFRH